MTALQKCKDYTAAAKIIEKFIVDEKMKPKDLEGHLKSIVLESFSKLNPQNSTELLIQLVEASSKIEKIPIAHLQMMINLIRPQHAQKYSIDEGNILQLRPEIQLALVNKLSIEMPKQFWLDKIQQYIDECRYSEASSIIVDQSLQQEFDVLDLAHSLVEYEQLGAIRGLLNKEQQSYILLQITNIDTQERLLAVLNETLNEQATTGKAQPVNDKPVQATMSTDSKVKVGKPLPAGVKVQFIRDPSDVRLLYQLSQLDSVTIDYQSNSSNLQVSDSENCFLIEMDALKDCPELEMILTQLRDNANKRATGKNQ